MAKVRAIGLTGPTEANYISACGQMMPKELGGGKTTLGVNSCLPMFETRAGYFGSGLGDGTRDRFLANVRDGVADERAYAKDSLASGPLLEAALVAMQTVETFITMFLGHIDNMIHQMTEAQMAEKQVTNMKTDVSAFDALLKAYVKDKKTKPSKSAAQKTQE